MTQSPEAVRARAARRRHLQQRQTVIFGSLIGALLVVSLIAGGIWSGLVPSPINVPLVTAGGIPAPTAIVPPCPPPDTLPVAYSAIRVNVFNGTETVGLAARTATSLREAGVQTGTEDNADPYGGTALITTGPTGVAAAYTLAALFPSSQMVVDARADDSVDVVVGIEFTALVPLEEVTLDPAVPIPAPAECTPLEDPTETATG